MAPEKKKKGLEATVVASEVKVERMSDTDSALQKDHDATRKMLLEVDKSNYLENGVSLVDTWDRVIAFHDTNDLVGVNIQRVQHILQETYDEHQRQKIADNNRLRLLFDASKDDPKVADDYTRALRGAGMERKSERNQIQQLADTVARLAKEYRSCAMQRAMFIHIAMIQQFTLMVTASIQRNVKDPHDLRTIIEDIKQAKLVCFPVQERE